MENTKELTEVIDQVKADVNKENAEATASLSEKVEILSKKLEKKEEKKASKILSVAGKDVDMDSADDMKKLSVAIFSMAKGDTEKVKTVLNTGTGAEGGFTLPTPLFNSLVQEADIAAQIRPLVTEIPMVHKTLDITELVKGDALVNVVDTVEGATKTETDADFAKVQLEAHKQAAVLPLTDELIDDSNFDLVKILIARFGAQIARRMDNLILNGNGTTQPEGMFINATVEAAATSTAGALTFDHLIEAMYSVAPEHRSNGVWFMNPAEMATLRQLKADGATGQYLWQAPVAAGQPATIHGYPVIENRFVPAGELIFGDPKAYWHGLRQDTSIRVSNEVLFLEDQTVIRAVLRTGGIVGFTDAFQKVKVTA